MSLEQALAANTAAIEKQAAVFGELIALLRQPSENVTVEAFTISPAAEAPKTKRVKMEAAPEAPAGEPAAPSPTSVAPAVAETEAAAAPAKATTYADAAAAVTKLIKDRGHGEAKKLLARFGGGNLKAVPEDRYDELIKAAEVLLSDEVPF